MKIIIMFSFLSFLIPVLSAQPLEQRQARFQLCLQTNEFLQKQLQVARDQYLEVLTQTRQSVDRLIASYEVRLLGDALQLDDLRATVELSMQLRDLDEACDAHYFELRESLLSVAWTEGVCVEELTFGQYQELFDTYLEDEAIRPTDHYASTYFASTLGFRSMMMVQLKAEEDWLERQGLDWSEPHPFNDLPVGEEMYWSVLSADWSIEFRKPEPQLSTIQLSAAAGGVEAKTKFKDIILFILDNWDAIKDILSWLEELAFSDCSPSVTSRIKSDTRDVNLMQELSPDVERRIYYQVGQRGVLADFRATRTRIWGKAKLYKRKRNRFVKDKSQTVGIAYCTKQWNVCDDKPWPANGQPFQFAGVHRRGKAKISERHPYALSIQQVNTEFINFPIFYNRTLVDQVHLLGSGGCF